MASIYSIHVFLILALILNSHKINLFKINKKLKLTKDMESSDTRIFTIKSIKAIIIKNLIEVIKPYIDDTNILISPDGIKISTLDSIAKSSVTYIKLQPEKFEKYECKKASMIGINIPTLYTTIKSANRRETITLFLDEKDPDNLGLELADPFMGKVKVYKIPLLTIDDPIIKISPIEYDSIINIPSNQFQQILKDIQLVEGKTVDIKSIDKQLIFSSSDGTVAFKTIISEIDDSSNKDQQLLLQQNGEDIKSVKFSKNSKEIIQGKFKLSYLLNFIKASHLCDNMNIYLTNNNPLILEYFVSDIGILRILLLQIVNEEN
jgi:proliferating cell nuclear antigen